MKIILSNTAGEPLYEQIKHQIKAQILSADLSDGELLPSIRSLAKDLRVSVITIKRAYDELEAEGFIYSMPGKGSFVAPQNPDLLKDRTMKLVEEKLSEALSVSRQYGLSDKMVLEILQLLMEDE
ncbi:GntR family transcriptional regulator [Microaceticoccus formicicus]|uniref:GntR family transcriptional regulator n=1 Tax=Microaceticoccus formicicus TaxID=3118105 RepID=UPI003CD010E3|nr:GntR family transcriptional regulator [Peptoniphilaceae bacterium AMB_02]